jgi:hypothetical protein
VDRRFPTTPRRKIADPPKRTQKTPNPAPVKARAELGEVESGSPEPEVDEEPPLAADVVTGHGVVLVVVDVGAVVEEGVVEVVVEEFGVVFEGDVVDVVLEATVEVVVEDATVDVVVEVDAVVDVVDVEGAVVEVVDVDGAVVVVDAPPGPVVVVVVPGGFVVEVEVLGLVVVGELAAAPVVVVLAMPSVGTVQPAMVVVVDEVPAGDVVVVAPGAGLTAVSDWATSATFVNAGVPVSTSSSKLPVWAGLRSLSVSVATKVESCPTTVVPE